MIIYDIYIKSVLGVIMISMAFISSIVGFAKENKKTVVGIENLEQELTQIM